MNKLNEVFNKARGFKAVAVSAMLVAGTSPAFAQVAQADIDAVKTQITTNQAYAAALTLALILALWALRTLLLMKPKG